jgi:hypothetical protein
MVSLAIFFGKRLVRLLAIDLAHPSLAERRAGQLLWIG